MKLQVYNTLSRKKEEFRPLQPGRVHIYVCGPTVYSDSHIGHAKSYISFDVIVRYFRYLGNRVKYVQNITDVGHLTDDADEGEDKISKEARQEKLDPMEVAQKYTWSYFDDMDALRVSRPNISPHATGHIIEQIELIKKLIEKGYAYEVNGSVYYDVSKFPEYGKLSGRKTEELEAGVRVEANPEKRHPNDFALWKKAEPGHLMHWPSPWSEGYPGWHIECSAMSMKYLGETFDIHGGGVDNVFPHHECEIAQSEAATGKPFARYWLHNNMVTVNGQKMAKSTGNFITIKEALAKYSPETLRYFILSSHYRSPLDFSEEALQAAEKGLERLSNTYEKVKTHLLNASTLTNFKTPFNADEYRQRFEKEMNDDFNSPKAIAVLFDFTRAVNQYLTGEEYHKPFLNAILELYRKLGVEILGILRQTAGEQEKSATREMLESIILVSAGIRQELRKQKQWELADKIREGFRQLGIEFVDNPDGTTTWKFK